MLVEVQNKVYEPLQKKLCTALVCGDVWVYVGVGYVGTKGVCGCVVCGCVVCGGV